MSSSTSELDLLSGEPHGRSLGDDDAGATPLRAGAERHPGAALEVLRLRRDDSAPLRRLAADIACPATDVPLTGLSPTRLHAQDSRTKPSQLHRHAGLAEIMASDESAKPMVSHGVIQLAPLLKWRGDDRGRVAPARAASAKLFADAFDDTGAEASAYARPRQDLRAREAGSTRRSSSSRSPWMRSTLRRDGRSPPRHWRRIRRLRRCAATLASRCR